ncbi:hypothetical protein [Streptomyces sp. MK5]|uniref:hypothetical protein n=1 Tax=Streptomyces sp. MK5 TaxID=3064253 RepID=UPI002741F8AE|nr:hypothetical protein [Streptomyces sp. MK5]
MAPAATKAATKETPKLKAQDKSGFVRLADDLKFGQPYDFKRDSEIDHTSPGSRGSATVLEYRSQIARSDKRPQELHDYLHGKYSWSALKVRVCNDDIEESGEATTSISVWPWLLELSDGSVASAFDDELPGFPRPLYPTDEEDLHSGACRTGNVIFAVPNDQRVTRVLYVREGWLPVAWADK